MPADDSADAKGRRAVKLISHPVTVAFGLANLYLLDLTGPVISSEHDLIYHLIGSASSIIVPIIVYVVALSALLAVVLALAERPGALRVILWSGLLLAIPSILLHTVGNFSGTEIPDWLTALVGGVCLAALLAISLFWKRVLPRFERIQPAMASILGFLAISGVFIFAQLLWNAWQARNLNAPRALHQAQADPAPRPRIIWLLLDELSYQQLYETRYPGLALPAFDRLAAQSTILTHVVPDGRFTRYIVPSLLTGLPSNEVDVSASGYLLRLRDPATGRWNRFEQHRTVFQDALDAGYTTGVDGWYNPYCRIMPQVLDHCFWTYRESTPANLSPRRSLASDLIRPFHYLLLNVKHMLGRGPGSPSDELRDIHQHSSDYRALVAAGDRDLTDPTITFLFLHMPIPHPYGFYDRKTRSFSSHHTSYIDNLALADQYLGHVREVLEEQHQWDSTTLIVMGDHSWRTSFIWKDSGSWTQEDEAASHGGQFDDRPAYLIKLAGQQAPERIDRPFPVLETRSLLDALFQNRIHDPSGLESWMRQQK